VIIIHCEITVHVLGVLCTHHQEYIKTVDAIKGTSHVLVWCRFKSIKIWPWSPFNRFKATPHRDMTCTCDCIYSFNVLLMMCAESAWNMYSKLPTNNKYYCLKLHQGFLLNKRVNFHSVIEDRCQPKSERSVSHFGPTCHQEGEAVYSIHI